MRIVLACWFLLIAPCVLEAAAETVCTFKGSVDLTSKNIQLDIDFNGRGKVFSSFKWEKDAAFLTSRIEHLKVKQSELSSELESSFFIERLQENKDKQIKGLIWTRYSLLNYKPFKELAGYFLIKEGRLIIKNLTWAEMGFSGQVNLSPPFDLEVLVNINDMDINELAPMVKVRLEDVFLSGLVSGKIKLSGYLNRLQLKGDLHSKEIEVQDLVYRDANINFSGYYPNLDISDSAISDEQGYVYNLTGRFNLEEINNFVSQEHQIKVSPFSEQDFASQGWMIRRKEEAKGGSETEMGYHLKSLQPTESITGQREGMLGIERKYRF